ncbi:hypothetical protein [Brachybacterium huguangmaarense]
MSRRSVFSTIGGLGVLALAACGLGGGGLSGELDDVAEGVEGVVSSELHAGPGGTFAAEVSGDIETSAADEAALRPIAEDVLRALAAHMVERGGDDADTRCGMIRVLAQDGTAIGPADLVPGAAQDLMTFATVADAFGA